MNLFYDYWVNCLRSRTVNIMKKMEIYENSSEPSSSQNKKQRENCQQNFDVLTDLESLQK